MMKCDDCPLKSDEFDYMESGIKMTVCPYWYEDCHLTPANMTIIKAMIAGKFDCEHCEHGLPFDGEDLQDFVGCGEGEGVRNADEWPCEKWQPKEGGE